MENASKALIIAGAILLAIVIISLGLIVVNNTRNSVDNANLNEQQIQSFNAKFTAYEGTSVSGTRVNSLIQQVISTNEATFKNGGDNFVAIAFTSANPTDANMPRFAIGYSNKAGNTGISYTTKKAPLNVEAIETDVFEGTNNKGIPMIVDKMITIRDGNGVNTPSGSLSVETGKNYNVILKYYKGLVAGIIVK